MAERFLSPVEAGATVRNLDSGMLGLLTDVPTSGFYYWGLLVSELDADGGYAPRAFYASSYGSRQTSGSLPGGIVLSAERVSVSVTYRNQYSGASGKGYAIPQADGFK